MRNVNPRILIVSHSSGIYGAERSLLILAKHLQEKGLFDLTVSCPSDGPLRQESDRCGVRNILLPSLSSLMTRFRIPRAVLRLPIYAANCHRALSLLHREKYDLVHCNTNVAIEAAFAAKKLGIPVVIQCRELLKGNPYTFFAGWKNGHRLIDRLAQRVICVSHYAKQELLQAGCSNDKLVVIHNCFETQNSEKDNHRRNSTPTIGSVAGIRPRKGFTTLLRALAIVKDGLPSCRLEIVGAGQPSHIKRLKQLATQLKIEGHTHFLGAINDPTPFYKRFTLLAVPSYAEAFGRVYGEAALHGIPAIGTSAGGASEIIEDGVTGYIVPPGDASALAEAMLTILRSPELAQQMGQRGKERVTAMFSVEKHIAQVTSLYQELLSTPTKGSETQRLNEVESHA